MEDLKNIVLPFTDVRVFMQEKWRISSDKVGSGNTTNIGSIRGTLQNFINGDGVFDTEKEFRAYWQGYKKTQAERAHNYSNVSEFRKLKND